MKSPRAKAGPALTLAAIRVELHAIANPVRGAHSQRFFKTGPGEYAEGDKFLGLTVPQMRTVARKYRGLNDSSALELLYSPWHARGDESRRQKIHRAYLANARQINNWDLVDLSAAQIVGSHLDPREIALLERLARSKNIWKRRIAIVSTFHFIRRNEFLPTLEIAAILLGDSHDLIHKAAGWMLREVGKRDRQLLDKFLAKHYRQMPRTMLRYAIERHPESIRKQYLAGTI